MTSDPAAAPHPHPSLSYRDAGVDIDAGARLVKRIATLAEPTARRGCLGGLGGFGALFELPWADYREPVLVSSTDGVGTKLALAIAAGEHDGIGIDLVAMCVNDILVSGAEPLFFLDYYATGQLDVEVATEVVRGIAAGCALAGCALVGGETAEMPGLYRRGDYDLAGFCVGIVEKSQLILPERVQPGDQLIALASSGPHANGYSLIRKVMDCTGACLHHRVEGHRLSEWLLEPTRIYVPTLLSLLLDTQVNGLAHITGGGLVENPPRMLPPGTRAVIDLRTWTLPPIFRWLQTEGRIAGDELRRTFNCGIGMLVCVPKQEADQALDRLRELGERAWMVGEIQAGEGPPAVEFVGDWAADAA